MAITIDPSTKRFILDSASVNAKSIYAAWVDWVASSDNAKYLPAFRTAGGDDLGGGLSIPPYYFLLNGWKVRPMESNHTLTIDGNLFVDGGGDPIVSTLGVYQVLVKSVVPVQAQGISTTGGSSVSEAALAIAVRNELATELARIDTAISTRATVAQVWSNIERTLTSGGGGNVDAGSAADIALAVRTELATELARIDASISSRLPENGTVGANVLFIRGQQITGTGSPNNPWRPA